MGKTRTSFENKKAPCTGIIPVQEVGAGQVGKLKSFQCGENPRATSYFCNISLQIFDYKYENARNTGKIPA